MKILIVEDEFNAREGLAALIGKIRPQDTVCGKAEDGEQGYRMALEFAPDVLFVDIELPRLNGLQMIEKILDSEKELPEKPQFVILSGYADFQYAQQAIRYGVGEYLLKPITVDKLEGTLRKLETANRLKSERTGRRLLQKDELLRSILLKNSDAAEALDTLCRSLTPEKLYLVNVYYGGSADITALRRAVDDFCRSCRFADAWVSVLGEQHFMPVFINTGCAQPELVQKIDYDLFYSIQKAGYRDATVTLLRIASPEELPDSLHRLTELNLWGITLGNDTAITPERAETAPQKDDKTMRRFDIEAITAIRNENIDELLQINRKLVAFLKEKKNTPQQTVKICTDYAFSILVCYKEYYTDLYERAQSAGIFDRLKTSSTMPEIAACLDDLAKLYKTRPQESRNVNSVLVRNVINLIADSYKGRVSLEDIAAKMNVSSEYLSRLFTKEVGANFSEYLKQYRIGIAKKLMANANYKIYEIGERIGYRDPKYFCKVFKEVTGFSPKEYMAMK